MDSEFPNEPMDIDSSGVSKLSPYVGKENDLNLFPVSVNESGEGLPYAPVDWPNPGDIWHWKVGKRIAVSGCFLDRYLYPPSHLRQAGETRGFASKLSVEHFVRAKFPDVNVDAFFASFSWKIPSRLSNKSMVSFQDDKEMPRRSGKKAKNQDADAHISEPRCKAGNKFCSSLSPIEDSVFPEVIFCDACCNETGFCRDCCCILCYSIIDKVCDKFCYIRCEAIIEGPVCGHNCHINCALRAYMAGTVGGSIGLDVEYLCRRCDSTTDLVPYVEKLLEGCRSIASRDDVEKFLGYGVCVLRGTKRTNAKQLLLCIESATSKLMNGTNLEDIWKVEDVSADIAGPDLNVSDAPGFPNNEEPKDHEMGPPLPFSSNFDHRVESLKLEDKVDHVLDSLRKSQEIEYRLAEERLLGQKRYLQDLFQQLENERSELERASSKDVRDLMLNSVLSRIDQIKREVSKLKDMKQVANGFGKVPTHVLKEQFGIDIED